MSRSGRPRNHDPLADEVRRAIYYDTLGDVQNLVARSSVDVLDGDARTPLLVAAMKGSLEVVIWLLSKGAKISHQDRNGMTALHFAVQEKHREVAGYLLEHGAAVDVKDIHGNTPLWRAAFQARKEYEFVSLLVAHGANPHLKNLAQRSPMDFALQIGDADLVAVLKTG
jgi:ankyrin repeat protein